ncbi:MAG: DNA mismatch repair protein MutL, partial [Ruminiclostridium sp.]|nr:DNA mismatch repair protein MutL [Ruminiclostridium sp.]
ITIRDLFYNVPARQKFLKRDVTEGNQVQGLIDKLALAHPDISFRFIRDNKPVRHTGGDGDYYSAIYAVFGKQFAMSLIPVDYSMNGVTVTGYTSSPLFTRPNRSMQYFFVNGRYVRSVICLTALEEGYRNSIMTGKFPACVLNITINPELCDVNVSPSKTEVRFADEKNIFDLINFGIKNAILNADNRREVKLEKKPVQNTIVEQTEEKPLSVRVEKALEAVPQDKYKEKIQKTLEDDRIYKVKEKPVIFHSPVSNIQPKKMEKTFVQQRIEEKTEINPVHIPEKKEESIEAEPVPEKEQYIAPVPEEKTDNTFKYISGSALQKTETVITEEPEKPSIKVIGELFATYILCQCGEEFIMIDKHAAHERINFEKKKTELMTSSQLLAESEYIDLSPEQYSVLSENTDKLMDVGIEVILTDGFRCEITACPSAFAGGNVRPSDIVIRCAELLCSGNDNIIGEIYDDLLHSRACKVSIKANDLNSREELRVIAEEVWNNEKIRFCPHGRPVMIKMTKQEIEKYFSRIV